MLLCVKTGAEKMESISETHSGAMSCFYLTINFQINLTFKSLNLRHVTDILNCPHIYGRLLYEMSFSYLCHIDPWLRATQEGQCYSEGFTAGCSELICRI
jgi:hypothetical protein